MLDTLVGINTENAGIKRTKHKVVELGRDACTQYRGLKVVASVRSRLGVEEQRDCSGSATSQCKLCKQRFLILPRQDNSPPINKAVGEQVRAVESASKDGGNGWKGDA
jgi:hypothetical protein